MAPVSAKFRWDDWQIWQPYQSTNQTGPVGIKKGPAHHLLPGCFIVDIVRFKLCPSVMHWGIIDKERAMLNSGLSHVSH